MSKAYILSADLMIDRQKHYFFANNTKYLETGSAREITPLKRPITMLTLSYTLQPSLLSHLSEIRLAKLSVCNSPFGLKFKYLYLNLICMCLINKGKSTGI